MTMSYEVNPDFTLRDIGFIGCTGLERVSNVKEALGILRLENPAIAFTEAAKAGKFNEMSDEEYHQLLSTFKCVADLFRYPDDPADAKNQPQMNILTLLSNAITKLVQLHTMLEMHSGARMP